MKAIKRTVAALLATLMLATSTSFTLAAETNADEDVVIAKVEAAGIMQGTGNGFEPSMTLTRAQAAAIVVRMKGISEDTIKKTSGETNFKDVAANEWYAPYVAQALITGIVKGVSATEFAPAKEVTIQEFVTMAIRALGAGQLVDSELTAWPTNYINFANENKLLDDVNAIPATVANRMQAATIVANTLEATMWKKVGVKSNGEISWGKTEPAETILNSVLKINKYLESTISDINTKDGKVDVTPNVGAGLNDAEVKEGVSLTTLKAALKYDVWYNTKDKKVVGIWKSEEDDNSVIEFTGISEIDTANKEITFTIDGSDKKYDYDTVSVKLNEANDSLANIEGAKFFGTAVINDNKITNIYAENYNRYGVVKEIKNDTIRFENVSKVAGTTGVSPINTDDEDLEFYVTKNGKDIKISDVEEGDALYFYLVGTTKYHIIVKNDTVEGKITAVGSDYVKVDGQKVKMLSGLSMNAGDEIIGYLNREGKIAMKEEVKGAQGDIAVVSSFRIIRNKYDEKAIEVALTTLDGTSLEVKELDLEETAKAIYGSNYTLANAQALVTAVTGDGTHLATLSNRDIVLDSATTGSALLGNVVKFSTSSNGYVFDQIAVGSTVLVKSTVDAADRISTKATSKSYNNDTYKLDGHKLTESTQVVLVKAGDESYEKKVQVVDFESIADATNTLDYYFADYDSSNNTYGVVIFTSEVARSKEDNYGVILTKASISNNNYNYEVSVLFADGVKDLLLAKKYDATLSAGNVIADVEIEGDELTDATLVTFDAGYNDKYELVRGFIVLNNGADSKFLVSRDDRSIADGQYDYYDINSDAIYFTIDDNGKCAEGKATAIKTCSDKENVAYAVNEMLTKKATYCEFLLALNEDNEYEVFAVAYGKDYDSIVANLYNLGRNVGAATIGTTGTSGTDEEFTFVAGTLANTTNSNAKTYATANTVASNDYITVTYTADAGYVFTGATTDYTVAAVSGYTPEVVSVSATELVVKYVKD